MNTWLKTIVVVDGLHYQSALEKQASSRLPVEARKIAKLGLLYSISGEGTGAVQGVCCHAVRQPVAKGEEAYAVARSS